MSYLYSPAQEAACLEHSCSDGIPLAMSKLTTTANGLLLSASTTESCPMLPSSAISKHSSVTGTPEHIRDWLMSSRQDSPANRSVVQEKGKGQTTTVISGQKPLSAFASLDPDTACWKTFQISYLTNTTERYSATWPRWGTMRSGVCYRLAPLVRHIHEKDCSWWPSPMACDANGGASAKEARRALTGERRKSGHCVTLKCQHLFRLRYGIQPRPIFWEWLMGWAPKWTGLEPLEMDRFQLWLEQHGVCSQGVNYDPS